MPLEEANKFTHASKHKGCMHGCGHDGHTAMLLGAAELLSANRDFDGTIHLIFQPGEEGGAGARVMMNEGLFKLFPVRLYLLCITGLTFRKDKWGQKLAL
ncbi:M20/M25/M40 family metallo-hydrolase [Klebsiella pneumoniae]|nr:M20/M25/M40 family metallo-hydrolase [Klebsiella pneumoniae]